MLWQKKEKNPVSVAVAVLRSSPQRSLVDSSSSCSQTVSLGSGFGGRPEGGGAVGYFQNTFKNLILAGFSNVTIPNFN